MFALSVICILLVLYYLRYLIKTTKRVYKASKMTANIPGPKTWPIIGNALLFTRIKTAEDAFALLTGLCNDFNSSSGLIKVWIGPRLGILVTNPKYIETILTSPDALRKDPIYKFIGLIGNGLFVRNGKKWEELRKPLNRMLNKKMIESNVEMFHEKSLTLCKVWNKYIISGQSFNLRHYATNFSLDTLCVSNFGYDLNELENEKLNIFELIERTVDAMLRVISNVLNIIHFPLVNVSKSGKGLLKLSKSFWKITCEILQARIDYRKKLGEDVDSTPSFYSDVLLQKAKHYNLNWEETGKLATDFLIAGFDTSAVTVSYILLMLAIFPEHQEAVYQEQVEILGEDPEVSPTWEQLSKMDYLTRIIKEVMRLYCPLGIFRNLTNDLELGEDYKLPKGCTVILSLYSLHRDPSFWSRPGEFYPDHFLPEECAKRPKGSYFPFSWGPRSCPGSVYAMAANKTLVSTVIRKYKFETDLTFDTLKYKYSLLLEVSQGYMVRIKPRN